MRAPSVLLCTEREMNSTFGLDCSGRNSNGDFAEPSLCSLAETLEILRFLDWPVLFNQQLQCDATYQIVRNMGEAASGVEGVVGDFRVLCITGVISSTGALAPILVVSASLSHGSS